TLAGVIKGCLSNSAVDKIYGMKNGVEGLLREDFVDIREYFKGPRDKNLQLLASTPASALGSCRKKINDDETIANIFRILEKYEIRYFFYIGGNDSMDAVMKLSGYMKEHPEVYKVNFIGVPKTIDNDLVMTDHTPGYGSAAKYIAVSMQEIMRDVAVYTTKAVTIVEIMGRDAGWLTAASALSNHLCGTGPALIYLPEVAFDNDNFIKDVKAKLNESDYVVVAVSEGIRDKDGNYAAEAAMSGATDTFGHKYLAGTGKYLEELVRKEIGCKVRSVELNILQRCASHISSKTDIDESIRTGDAAVRFAVEGESGKMVVVRRIADSEEYAVETAVEDVKEIANKIKKMPKSFIDTKNNFVTDKCIEYMLPLIQGEYPSQFEDGLPVHFVF
ncbi:MAG: 6-phosphofructokinase, partial [Clostridia bacterium]|nr:6-phosphofructokinase [Clostridia bacterium]